MEKNETSPASQVVTQPSASTKDEQADKFRKKVIKCSFIGVLAVAVILAGAYALQAFLNSPERISNKFVDSLQANDVSGSYKLVDETSKKSLTENDLATLFANTSAWVKGGESIIENHKQSDKAVFVYKVPNKDGDKYIKTVLTHSEKGWRVSYFNASSEKFKTDIKSF